MVVKTERSGQTGDAKETAEEKRSGAQKRVLDERSGSQGKRKGKYLFCEEQRG